MTHRNRLIVASAALFAALLAPLLIAAPAGALTAGDEVLFFSNASFTDVGEEDANMIAALQASGATVTSFDGGDGSVVTWAAALTATTDVLVIPENGGAWASLIVDVRTLIIQWISDGGILVLGYFGSEAATISEVTGLDYSTPWATGYAPPYPLQIVDPALPAELLDANGTNAIDTAAWGAGLSAIFTPIYADGTVVAVGRWTFGDGLIYGFGWDWFPDSGDVTAGIPAPWNTVLQTLSLADPIIPAPELAATGVDAVPLSAAAATLLLGGLGLFAIRRRKSESTR